MPSQSVRICLRAFEVLRKATTDPVEPKGNACDSKYSSWLDSGFRTAMVVNMASEGDLANCLYAAVSSKVFPASRVGSLLSHSECKVPVSFSPDESDTSILPSVLSAAIQHLASAAKSSMESKRSLSTWLSASLIRAVLKLSTGRTLSPWTTPNLLTRIQQDENFSCVWDSEVGSNHPCSTSLRVSSYTLWSRLWSKERCSFVVTLLITGASDQNSSLDTVAGPFSLPQARQKQALPCHVKFGTILA